MSVIERVSSFCNIDQFKAQQLLQPTNFKRSGSCSSLSTEIGNIIISHLMTKKAQNKSVTKGLLVKDEHCSPTIELFSKLPDFEHEAQITEIFSGQPGHVKCLKTERYMHGKEKRVKLYMEQMDGDLARVRDGLETILFKQLVKTVRDVAIGIWTMHAGGYYHGDIKPNNMLYNKDGGAICDYGFSDKLDNFSKRKQVYGHPSYVAPEIRDIVDKVDIEKAEMFAFGRSLYEIFECYTPMWVKPSQGAEKISIQLKDLKGAKCYYDSRIKELIFKMMSIDPKERPTFQEVIQSLEKTE